MKGSFVAVSDLSSVVGEVLGASDAGFDEARSLWNVRFDRRPDLIVRCSTGGDVKAAVDHARESGMRLAVKGGGHSYAANSVGNGGLLIDLSQMNAVSVDSGARTVIVEGGVTCADVDPATQVHGLATPTPTAPRE